MRKQKVLYIFLICIFSHFNVWAQIDSSTATRDSSHVDSVSLYPAFIANIVDSTYMGTSVVRLSYDTFPPVTKGIYFINVHENESTSITAAAMFFKEFGGQLICLHHSRERIITFYMNGQLFRIDPNRIFTATGRKQTLKLYSRFTINADEQVASFAKYIISKLVSPKLIIALHNNTNKEFSVKSYRKSLAKKGLASNVYINPAMDEDDFILTTERKVFNHLKRRKVNAVLEPKNAKDDGALSIYCAKKKIPYINVEAEHNQTAEQLQLLNELKEVVKWYE